MREANNLQGDQNGRLGCGIHLPATKHQKYVDVWNKSHRKLQKTNQKLEGFLYNQDFKKNTQAIG